MTEKDFVKPFLVEHGRNFRLKDYDPASTHGFESSEDAEQTLRKGVSKLSDMQEKLYAFNRWAVLLIFQAMDAAGKDGAIRHVMSGVNPQGCQVFSFKSPSDEELDHDFLWRCALRLPERGRIGIFNRSYYEETLVVRVHPELLQRQNLPDQLVSKKIWTERFEDINGFEQYLSRQGIAVRKFFLNVSKGEQKRRFLRRLDEPDRNWKFAEADLNERQYWDRYMDAYQEMIRHTATPHAPWYVVPADNKWFTRLVVAAAIIETLERLNPKFPEVDGARQRRLMAFRATLARKSRSRARKSARSRG